MTYRFKFSGLEEPHLEVGRRRAWGGLSAVRLRATPGRHESGLASDHRLIFYLSGGVAAECAVEDLRQKRIQDPFEFDLVPAGAEGSWTDEAPCEMVVVRLEPSLLAVAGETLGMRAGRVDLAPRLGARDPLIGHVVSALTAELDAPAPAGRLYAESLGLALSTRLLQDHAVFKAPTRQTLSKRQARALLSYIDDNLDGDLSLESLAGVLGISVPHLTPLFRRTLGQSVHAYVMERRVHRARAFLMERRLSVAQVALETGFAHPSHLARWMRRLLGVTPSMIRVE